MRHASLTKRHNDSSRAYRMNRDICRAGCPWLRPSEPLASRPDIREPELEVLVALAEHPSSVAQQSSTAPTLSTDRLSEPPVTPPAPGAPTSGSFPNEDYRGWASL